MFLRLADGAALPASAARAVLVHICEEFFAHPRAGYERTLAFLGLPTDGRTDFQRVNENWVPRSWFLLRLDRNTPSPLKRLYRPLKWTFNAFGLRPGSAILHWNSRPEKRRVIDPSFRRRLAAEFEPDIARLEVILGRDLDVWRSNEFGSQSGRNLRRGAG